MPRTARSTQDEFLLSAALEGLLLQKQRIDAQIQQVRALLGKNSGRRGRPPGPSAAKSGTGRLSAAARKRIAAAQKRRWAEYRKSAAKGE